MKNKFPRDTQALLGWTWREIELFYQELNTVELQTANLDAWLKDWSDLISHLDETYTRLFISTTQSTADPDVEQRFNTFIESIQPNARAADQELKKKLLDSRLEPKGFELPLRKMRTEASLYREANLPLFIEEQKLNAEYNRLIGGLTYAWQGQERTATEMFPLLQDNERSVREKAWHILTEGRLKIRAELNDLWGRLMTIRMNIAANNGLPDYRAYIWDQKFRFDYTPDDCKAFHRAIEEVVVPAARRVFKKHQKMLGLDTIRPWDTSVDPFGKQPLRPFTTADQLTFKTKNILERVDP